MRYSFVTAVYNKLSLTKKFWESLTTYPPPEPWEIIWIDDGSTDGTREWLATLPIDRCRMILNENNVGFAVSNNLGASIAKGEILCFLNNDIVLTASWFEPMVHYLKSPGKNGLSGCIQVQPAAERIDHAGICFDLVGQPDHILKNRASSAVCGSGRYARAVTAACCMIRRDLFLSAGGFDEQFRNGCEDVDLCLRLGDMGYRHWVAYLSVVYHHVSSSPGRKDYENRNQALFLQRWGHLTARWGQEDWPQNYLSKHLYCPWKLNGSKTVDALMRLAGLKHGDSKWAAQKRKKIMAQLVSQVADASST